MKTIFPSRRNDGSLDLLATFVSRREMSVGSFIGYNSTGPENVQTPGTAPEHCH